MEVQIDPADKRTREQLFSDIRERLGIVPAQFTIGQPISHRIEHMVSGQRSALSVKVFGEDLRQFGMLLFLLRYRRLGRWGQSIGRFVETQ